MSMPTIGVMIARVPSNGMPRESISKTWDMYANYAAKERMKTLLFDPSGVSKDIRTVSGWEYQFADHERPLWQWVTRRIPEVVYDGAFLKDIQHNFRYKRVRRKLRQKRYRIFNPAFPNKYEIHKYLASMDTNRYLPITKRVYTSGQLVRFLDQERWVFLKPIRGTGGKGIVEVKKTWKDTYTISHNPSGTKPITRKMSRKELRLFLNHLLSTQAFMAQRAVSLIGTDEQRIDFRVALYRNRSGKWRSVGVICKLGYEGSPVTNFHSGGIIIPYSKVVAYQKEYRFPLPSEQRLIKAAMAGAIALSRKYPNLGILGIDVGVDKNGDLWLLDFNPRQGRDIMTTEQIDAAMKYTAEFAKFLLTSKGERV
jgi:hypothetical protein